MSPPCKTLCNHLITTAAAAGSPAIQVESGSTCLTPTITRQAAVGTGACGGTVPQARSFLRGGSRGARLHDTRSDLRLTDDFRFFCHGRLVVASASSRAVRAPTPLHSVPFYCMGPVLLPLNLASPWWRMCSDATTVVCQGLQTFGPSAHASTLRGICSPCQWGCTLLKNLQDRVSL